jgi:hypothetical protein
MSQKQMNIAGKDFVISDDLKTIADDLIKNDPVLQTYNLDIPRIGYILVYPNITKHVAGRCIKSGRELKFFSECDYVIEMSGETWDVLEDDVKKILTLHELMHIHVFHDKKGNVRFKLRDHDVKDFMYIIKTYGIDWFERLRTVVSSTYDMKPDDESKIKI